MKKGIVFILALLVSVVSFTQTVDEILDNYFETINQEKVLEISSMTSKGKVIQMGMELPFLQINQRPGQTRLEIEFQGSKMIQAYDGANGWMIAPMSGSSEPQDITGPPLKSLERNADMDGELYNWKEKGHSLELIGTEDMEGTEVYNLKLTKDDGEITHYFFDTEFHLLLKTKSKVFMNNTEMNNEMYLSNYKQVNNMFLPHSMENRFNGLTQIEIIIDEYKFNEDYDDSFFKKPVSQ